MAGPNQEPALNHSENSGSPSVDTLNVVNKKVKRTKSELVHKHNENEEKQAVDQYDESSEKSTELDAAESETGERDEIKRIKELRRIEKFLLEEKKQLELLEKEQEVATAVVNKPNSPIKIKISLNNQDSKSTTSSLVNRSTPKEVCEEAAPEKTESIKLNLGELVRNCKTKLGILPPPSEPAQADTQTEPELSKTPALPLIEQVAAEPVAEATPPEEIKEAVAVEKQLNRSTDDEIIIIEDVEEAKNVEPKEEEVAKETVVSNEETDLIEPVLNEETRPDPDSTRIEQEPDVVLIEKKIVASPEPLPAVSPKQPQTPDPVKQQLLYLQQLQELQQQKRHLQELNQQKQQQQQKLAQHQEQLAAAVTSNGANQLHSTAKSMESFKKFQEIKELQNKKCIDELRVTYEQLIDEIKYNSGNKYFFKNFFDCLRKLNLL